MGNTFRKVYRKTGSSGTDADYELIANVGVGGVNLDIMKGASSDGDGEIGLVPKPIKGQENYILTGNGTWIPQNQITSSLNNQVSKITSDIKNINTKIGETNISSIGSGTITNAIGTLNNQYNSLSSRIDNKRDKYGVAYANTEIVNTATSNSWNIYPNKNLGFRPNVVIAIAQSAPGIIIQYDFDGSTSSYLHFLFYGTAFNGGYNPLPSGGLRFCYVVFYND